jgi:hypothetical protein
MNYSLTAPLKALRAPLRSLLNGAQTSGHDRERRLNRDSRAHREADSSRPLGNRNEQPGSLQTLAVPSTHKEESSWEANIAVDPKYKDVECYCCHKKGHIAEAHDCIKNISHTNRMNAVRLVDNRSDSSKTPVGNCNTMTMITMLIAALMRALRHTKRTPTTDIIRSHLTLRVSLQLRT